mmetsp:Transcript_9984/g.15101  ORF Transcript_9984/g.15101 Transcript_9984/m.15101 type:complete len:82 (+) Transcript_9984:2019-2264(+)
MNLIHLSIFGEEMNDDDDEEMEEEEKPAKKEQSKANKRRPRAAAAPNEDEDYANEGRAQPEPEVVRNRSKRMKVDDEEMVS